MTRGASAPVNWRAADRLGPAYQEVLGDLHPSEQLSADEAGGRVGGWPAWLQARVGDRSSCYAIDPHRRAGALGRVSGRDWGGVSVHGGGASCGRFESAPPQPCVAHVLRRARELLATAPRGAGRFPRPVIALLPEAVPRRQLATYLARNTRRAVIQA